MNKLKINNTIIEILVGDLINQKCDSIILPTNSRLLPSGTLRVNVLRNAGAKVQIECNSIINKITSIQVGNAVITSGGNLKSKHIIHAVGPRLGEKPVAKKLMYVTWNCLKLADKKGLKSITFPPISREMLGFTAHFCADVMLQTIKKYVSENNKNLENISICLETLPDYKEFEKVLDNLTD